MTKRTQGRAHPRSAHARGERASAATPRTPGEAGRERRSPASEGRRPVIRWAPWPRSDEPARPPLRILLAGGGTGGHLYPGIALADELIRRRPGTQVVLAGTGRPAEARALAGTGFGHADLGAAPGARGARGLARFLAGGARAAARSARLVRRFRPDLVIGLGGYASLACALVARAFGVPLALLEQNALPGRANRLLARFATGVYAAFAETAEALPRAPVEMLGNPVRLRVLEKVPSARAELGLDPALPTLLVMGGSQGARGLNLACEAAAPAWAGAERRLQVLHLAGAADEARLRASYARAGLRAKVFAFRDDMATCYAAADLALARAGGTTIAELCARGLPSVLVPYPAAADDHQTVNARAVERAGAALCVPEVGLAGGGVEQVGALLADRARLAAMADAARAAARPDAARAIAARLLETLDDCR